MWCEVGARQHSEATFWAHILRQHSNDTFRGGEAFGGIWTHESPISWADRHSLNYSTKTPSYWTCQNTIVAQWQLRWGTADCLGYGLHFGGGTHGQTSNHPHGLAIGQPCPWTSQAYSHRLSEQNSSPWMVHLHPHMAGITYGWSAPIKIFIVATGLLQSARINSLTKTISSFWQLPHVILATVSTGIMVIAQLSIYNRLYALRNHYLYVDFLFTFCNMSFSVEDLVSRNASVLLLRTSNCYTAIAALVQKNLLKQILDQKRRSVPHTGDELWEPAQEKIICQKIGFDLVVLCPWPGFSKSSMVLFIIISRLWMQYFFISGATRLRHFWKQDFQVRNSAYYSG